MAWLPALVTVPAAADPISLDEAKAQAHVELTNTDNDVELEIYRKAARELVEQYTGLKLITQTVLLRAGGFEDLARLPVAPVQSISSIAYLDSDGAAQTLSTDVWEAVLGGLEGEIRPQINQAWPATRSVSDAVRVTAVCGYGDSAVDVPNEIRLAMLVTVEDLFEDREGQRGLPLAAELLLSNFRLSA